MVGMERAEAQQVGSVPVQLDVPRLGEPLHRYLPFQPLDLVLRDSCHFQPSAEKPVGEWNTYQTVCRSNTVEIIVNGTSMNKLTGCNVSSGFIGLQSEGAELEIRKVYLEPLK